MKKLMYFSIVFLAIIASSQSVFADQRLYHFLVNTTNVEDAGTDAKISIKLYGTQGEADFKEVNDAIDRDAFERNHGDSFDLSYEDVGIVWKIEVQSNMGGKKPKWHLTDITVGSSMPNTIQSNTFRFNRWIDTTSIYPQECDGYQPPIKTYTMGTTLYNPVAYIYDNLTNMAPSGKITRTHQLTVGVVNQYSSSVEASQQNQLTANWGATVLDALKIGGDYSTMWTKTVKDSATSTVNLTSVLTTSFDIQAEAQSYTIRILTERYEFNNHWYSDSFNAIVFREMRSVPILSFIKTFNFGPAYPKVAWGEFSDPSWHEAIKSAMGTSYNSIVRNLQNKGYLEDKPRVLKKVKYPGPLFPLNR